MASDISAAHPTIWHYTTAEGLHGILTSQQLWATNFSYLNDDEELKGFFSRKLPMLVQMGVEEGLKQLRTRLRGDDVREFDQEREGMLKTIVEALSNAIATTTLRLDIYVASFSFINADRPGDAEDGLLSQWRGYGQDGGYAIAFDTEGIHTLLEEENKRYQYAFLNFSDVDYHQDDWVSNKNRFSETLDFEQQVIDTCTKVACEGLESQLDSLFVPILSQAVRHKHRGFSEEQEVRVAAVRLTRKLLESADGAHGNVPPHKTVSFYPRKGVLVPYIAFFDAIPDDQRKLPIQEIIVGPHPDKLKRKKAIEMRLEELGLNVPVRVSEIPYLGR